MAGHYGQQTAAYSGAAQMPPPGRSATDALRQTPLNCLDDACSTATPAHPTKTLDTGLQQPLFREMQSVDPTGFNGDLKKAGRPGLNSQWYLGGNYFYRVTFMGGRYIVTSVDSLDSPYGKAILKGIQDQEKHAKELASADALK